jgi:U4/U6.U5 tri-snRNP-associated protein 1
VGVDLLTILCKSADAFCNYRVRNRRELHASLKGTTLGDPDGDTEDTLKWIKKAKKRDKQLAKKRQQELDNLDKAFQGDEYTESTCFPQSRITFLDRLSTEDLVGLKVSHDFEDLGEGDARILTLKDSRILDNEGASIASLALPYTFFNFK